MHILCAAAGRVRCHASRSGIPLVEACFRTAVWRYKAQYRALHQALRKRKVAMEWSLVSASPKYGDHGMRNQEKVRV